VPLGHAAVDPDGTTTVVLFGGGGLLLLMLRQPPTESGSKSRTRRDIRIFTDLTRGGEKVGQATMPGGLAWKRQDRRGRTHSLLP
jgi:hypothetical protein